MICPVCGTRFHYCSSCNISSAWEASYCSEKCWHASRTYTEMRQRFGDLYAAMDPAVRARFVDFVEDIMASDFDEVDVREWGRDLS